MQFWCDLQGSACRSQWNCCLRNRTKPHVFSHKVAPDLVCATGAGFARLRSNACSIVKLNSGVQIALQWLHCQTKMSGIRTCRRQRLLTDHAVDGRASQAVSGCSCRLPLVFTGASPSRNFRHPACPGSTYIYIYI